MRRLSWFLCAAGLAAGCCHIGRPSCCGPDTCAAGYSYNDAAPRAALLAPHPLTPCQVYQTPPQPSPVTNVLPRSTPTYVPAPGPTPAPPVLGTPPADTNPPSAAPPANGAAAPGQGPMVQLSGPQTEPPPAVAQGPSAATPPTATVPPQPAVKEAQTTAPSLPVGIPQFAIARKNVASGLRPILDGLDWLAAHGYRTALHVHLPGQDDSSDRKQFEARGIRYVSLEVSPETLARDVVDQFNHAVSDAGNQPLFVYDRDGTLAGGLWYLYFRVAEGATDADARARAERLGLRPDQEGEGKLMWLAVQSYLSKMKP